MVENKKLSDVVYGIIEREGINQAGFAKICGLDTVIISHVCNDKYVAMRTIATMAEKFPEVKRFVKYKQCKICGADFLPGRRSITCSPECQAQNNKELKQKHNNKLRKKTALMRTEKERYDWKIKGLKEAKVSINEFMAGGDYGQRQREYLLSIQKTQRMEIR